MKKEEFTLAVLVILAVVTIVFRMAACDETAGQRMLNHYHDNHGVERVR